ncbi:hypothetical protein CEXT_626711 [Caerostris extrusa]|uniref:Uncharacterized protein n=1 Tax=Caerostris extrusa TaxID=172846 RepID=A0AAV4RKV7_CAEEX|nr:hypothetical protein CEXT_626711 [Caerostris extrusa]
MSKNSYMNVEIIGPIIYRRKGNCFYLPVLIAGSEVSDCKETIPAEKEIPPSPQVRTLRPSDASLEKREQQIKGDLLNTMLPRRSGRGAAKWSPIFTTVSTF